MQMCPYRGGAGVAEEAETNNAIPVCSWTRIDGQLNAALLRQLLLRCLALVERTPGSTAAGIAGMLLLLDTCEVATLLDVLVFFGALRTQVFDGKTAYFMRPLTQACEPLAEH